MKLLETERPPKKAGPGSDGADAPHVYVRASTLSYFHSLVSTQAFRRALTESVDKLMRGDKIECPFSGATNSGRVWRKVPESEA